MNPLPQSVTSGTNGADTATADAMKAQAPAKALDEKALLAEIKMFGAESLLDSMRFIIANSTDDKLVNEAIDAMEFISVNKS